MATLSSAGIGSGLDVDKLVTQLMTFERTPVTVLDKKEASYQAKLSSIGSLKSSLSSLQTAAKTLSTPDKFSPTKASVTDSTILAASAGSTAVTGSYDVEVVRLASAQKLIAPTGYSATSSAVGQGTITIDFGTYVPSVDPLAQPGDLDFSVNPDKPTAKTITIGSGNNTLAGIRDAINAANAGVSASIVNDGTNGYRLSLTSADSGARNAMRISVAPGSDPATLGDLGNLAYDASLAGASTSKMTQNVAAGDAVIKVDNVSIVKPSNTITDAIQGVTLNLAKTTATGVSTKITLARDTTNVKTAIEGFVKAYNDTTKAMKDATAFNTTTGQAAVLTGDSTIRSLQTQLRNVLASPVAGAPKGSAILSDAGLSFDKDGALLIDNEKLAAAIADPAKDLSKLFSSGVGTKGYAWQTDVLLGKLLSPIGPLNNRANAINDTIKRIGDDRDALNARLVGVEARYRAQFSALDTLVSKMSTTSSFLTQQLTALAANSSS
jgi:flagellar hook-associated protein 2